MNFLTGGGCLIKIVAAVVALAACGLAMFLGLKDVRAGGAGCIAGGAVVILLAKRDPRYRDGRLAGWGLLVAGAGVATFIWPNWFNERARVSEHIGTVNDKLGKSPASGTNALAVSKAEAYRALVLDFEKQQSIKEGAKNCSVFVELDGADAKSVKKASVYVETDALRFYGPDKKKAIAERMIKQLQADFGGAACNFAARGSFHWGVKASSAAPGQAPTVTLNSDKPNF
jgi:hypothetical protein